MPDKLSREDEFLLKEYETAVHLTFHVDELRSRFTNLFITIAGAAAAAISLLLKENSNNTTFGQFEFILGVFLLLVFLVGMFVIAVIARLRRVQLEHFRITNNIRKHFLGKNYSLWNVVELSSETLPSPNIKSGTFFWSMVIMLLNSYFIALAIYLFLAEIWYLTSPQSSFVVAIIGAVIFILLQSALYFCLATPPKPLKYSKKVPPE